MPTYEHLSGRDVDHEVKTLLHTFLTSFFDGASHAIGDGAAKEFPQAVVAFDQGPIPQPLQGNPAGTEAGLEIRVIFEAGRMERFTGESGWDVLWPGTLQFLVRAKVGAPALKLNSKSLAQRAGDRLHDLLQNPKATEELAEAGITEFRPRKAITRSSEQYEMRVLLCPVQLVYSTQF